MLFFTIHAYTQKTPDHNLLKGIVSWELKDYDSAIYYFRSSEVEMKNYPISFVYYGMSLLETGHADFAIQELQKAELIEKGLASFWLSKAYARSGDIGNALEYLKTNMQSRYKEPESKVLLDTDIQRMENHPKWKEYWQDGNYYTSFDLVLSEADYLINAGKYTDALAHINQNLSKAYRKSPLYSKRSAIYTLMNNYRMAIEDIERAIEGDRRNVDLLVQKADLLMNTGKYKQALEGYDIAIKTDPYKIHIYPKRAMAKSYTGSYEPAVIDMQFYLNYLPLDHFNWYQLGKIHFASQKYFNALECLHKALQLNQERSEYFEARGETYLRTKTFRYASNDFSMALDINPKNPKTYLNKGIAALNLSNLQEACFCFQMAKEYGLPEADDYLLKHCKP